MVWRNKDTLNQQIQCIFRHTSHTSLLYNQHPYKDAKYIHLASHWTDQIEQR